MVQVIDFKRIAAIMLLAVSFSAMANVSFKFKANTIDNGALKNTMERQISAVLSAVNATAPGGAIDYTGIDIEEGARVRLDALFSNVPFSVDKQLNISACLHDMQGYQVRGINVTMKPQDASYDQSLNRQLTVSLNRSGVITGVRLAMESQEDMDKIMQGGRTVEDLRRRREILKFVEDFRCFYNEKNLEALRAIFSDDTIIITGSVMKQRKLADGGIQVRQVRHTVQNKEQYMSNLARCFRNNRWINLGFDRISVAAHGSKENIYGVTLHQSWRSSTYNDDGWLFLLWDFNDEEHPQILVRTWQEDQAAAAEGVFSHHDFFFP